MLTVVTQAQYSREKEAQHHAAALVKGSNAGCTEPVQIKNDLHRFGHTSLLLPEIASSLRGNWAAVCVSTTWHTLADLGRIRQHCAAA